MKKIGLIGGLGPASTVDYYFGLIEKYRKEFGEDVYPELVIDSVNMHSVIDCVNKKNYETLEKYLLQSFNNLKNAGAQVVAITSNTPHIVWNKIKSLIPVASVSIIDSSIAEMLKNNYKRVLVLGTTLTMKNGLYEIPMKEKNIIPILPTDEDKEIIGNLIYPNLENGIIIQEDKIKMHKIIEKYIAKDNPDAVLLGCTEIPLVVHNGDVSRPVLNTTQIHLNAIYDLAKKL